MSVSRVQPRILSDFARARAELEPERCAFRQRVADVWTGVTWREFLARAEALAKGLAAVGVTHGSRLAIMAPTSLDWELFQLAALLNGAAVAGFDPHDQPTRVRAMMATADIDTLVVADSGLLEHLALSELTSLRRVIGLAGAPPMQAHASTERYGVESLLRAGEGAALPNPPSGDDPATLIFTSGSTGEPKGILYTHAQVVLAVESILQAFPEIGPGDRMVCWLPLSNLFQRMLNYCAAGRGAETWLVGEPQTIMQRLPEIRPHVFIAVPRFFEKLEEGIRARLNALPAWSRVFAEWALSAGDAHARRLRAGTPASVITRCSVVLADRLVLRRLRAVLGGEVRYLVSGSAAFPAWLLERFQAMGLLVLEAYGLSENVVPVALNRPTAWRFGTVGKVLPANEIRLAEDGEVLVRGGGVCHNYLGGDQAATDAEGFLATGDLGALDEDGFLTLVGRKSEIFKTSTGRKVAPLPVEAALRRLPGVDQAVLLGAGKKTPVAIITLTASHAETDLAVIATTLAARVPEALRDLPTYSHPAGLLVLSTPFGIASGELTSNLKLRRAAIHSQRRPA
ncbi:MAG: hypothetical protein RL434_2739, partial [Pseudomonadota bacterium]